MVLPTATMVRHIPNLITASRGLCGPVCTWLLVAHQANRAAFWLFLAAICTDLVDGFAARILDAISPMGKWLDGLSDKVLTDFVWVGLALGGFCPGWLAGLIIARDLAVIVAWLWAFRVGKRWEASPMGQVMVAFEGVAVCVLLFHGPWLDVHWPSVGTVIGAISLALSLASLVGYVRSGPVDSRS